jgi:hypothetical protein
MSPVRVVAIASAPQGTTGQGETPVLDVAALRERAEQRVQQERLTTWREERRIRSRKGAAVPVVLARRSVQKSRDIPSGPLKRNRHLQAIVVRHERLQSFQKPFHPDAGESYALLSLPLTSL